MVSVCVCVCVHACVYVCVCVCVLLYHVMRVFPPPPTHTHTHTHTHISTGLSLDTFHGNFFVRSTDLLSLPNVNPDHGFTMNLAIDESLKDVSMASFQAALLYTSSRGTCGGLPLN